jgi:hypothetical protein
LFLGFRRQGEREESRGREKEFREKGAGKGERGGKVEKEYKANIHHRQPENFSPHVFLAHVGHIRRT